MRKTAFILALISLLCLSSCEETKTNIDRNFKATESISSVASTNKESINPNEANLLYSDTEWEDYYYQSTSNNETIKLLEGIHKTEHGTAGSFVKELSSACNLIQLARLDVSQLQCIPEHLNNMTELQLDYLSYQLHNAFELAQSIIQKDEHTINVLDEFNFENNMYNNCCMADLFVFMGRISSFLVDADCKYYWSNTTSSNIYF